MNSGATLIADKIGSGPVLLDRVIEAAAVTAAAFILLFAKRGGLAGRAPTVAG